MNKQWTNDLLKKLILFGFVVSCQFGYTNPDSSKFHTPTLPNSYLTHIKSIDLAPSQILDIRNDEERCIDWLSNESICRQEKEQIEKAIKVLEGARFISDLGEIAAGRPLEFPIGITGAYGSFTYNIAFNNFKLKPTGSTFDVVASLDFIKNETDTKGVGGPSESSNPLYFAAINVPYSNRRGFYEEVTLELLSDYGKEINTGKSALIFRAKTPSTQGTYMKVSCEGISELGVSITAIFNNSFLKPAVEGAEYVQGNAEFIYDQSNGFRVDNLSLTPFFVQDFEEVAFNLSGVYIDLDDQTTTVPIINAYYEAGGNQSGLTVGQWKGFYAEQLEAVLLTNAIQRNSEDPISFLATDLLIDNLGVTAQFEVYQQGLVPFGQSNIGGWDASLDGARMDMLMSKINAFGLSGSLQVPFLGDRDDEYAVEDPSNDLANTQTGSTQGGLLIFDADYLIEKRELDLTIELGSRSSFGAKSILGDIELTEGSAINATSSGQLATSLNGKYTLKGGFGEGSKLSGPSMDFSELRIANHTPYFGVGSFTFTESANDNTNADDGGADGDLGLFGFKINQAPALVEDPQNDQLYALQFYDIGIDLGDLLNGKHTEFGGSFAVKFLITTEEGSTTQVWKNNGIDISGLYFQSELLPFMTVTASLSWYNDREGPYGNGFAGIANVAMDFVPGEINATALFGTKSDFKYSYVDAKYLGTSAPPLSPHSDTHSQTDQQADPETDVNGESQENGEESTGGKGFSVNSLQGGYYNNMRRGKISTISTSTTGATELGGFDRNKFTPEDGVSGFNAGAFLALGKGATVSAEIRAEFEDTQNGIGKSLSYLYFLGQVTLLAKQEDNAEKSGDIPTDGAKEPSEDQLTDAKYSTEGKLGGYISLKYKKINEEDKEFNAQFGIYYSSVSFDARFIGSYGKNTASDIWHFALGLPDNRNEIVSNTFLPPFTTSVSFYFMVGNDRSIIPSEQPPPYASNSLNQQLLNTAYKILRMGATNPDYNKSVSVDEDPFVSDHMSAGNGLAFGVQVGLNIHLDFAKVFYAYIGADIGFDLLYLYKIRNCTEAFSEGDDKWQMRGQLYAAASAAVGLQVGRKQFQVFRAGIAVILQADMPKPSGGRGAWTFEYNVLAGLIRGKADGEFKFGDYCDQNYPLVDLSKNPIEFLGPSVPLANSDRIRLNSDIDIIWNLEVEREAEAYFIDGPEDDTPELVRYKFELSKKSLTDEQGNVQNRFVVLPENPRLTYFEPSAYLRPESNLRLDLKGVLYEYPKNGGRVIATDGDGKEVKIDISETYKAEGFLPYDCILRQKGELSFFDENSTFMSFAFKKSLKNLPVSQIISEIRELPDIQVQEVNFTPINTIFNVPFREVKPETSYEWFIKGVTSNGNNQNLIFNINSLQFTTGKELNFE